MTTTIETKTYSTKANAARAAKKALETAPEGTTYEIEGEDKAFSFKLVMNSDITVDGEVEAHDPAETMKSEDTISAPVEIPESQPELVEEDPAPATDEVEETPAANRPFGYLPEDTDELVAKLGELAGNGGEEELRKIADDAGVPFSELRSMTKETAVSHLVKIIAGDRAAWDVDFGGKKAPRETVKKEFSKKSAIENPCKVVWDTAAEMMAKAGGLANLKRKDVLAACEAKGVAHYTARTQYQQWLVATKASQRPTEK